MKCERVYLSGIAACCMYRDADKSLDRSGKKQATATEDFDFNISSQSFIRTNECIITLHHLFSVCH
jgi:hypothetical protein